MATDSTITTRHFAAACGLLRQYAAAARMMAAPLAPQPGTSVVRQEGAAPAAASNAQQLTIFYGGMVVVMDACTPEKAAELMRLAAEAAGQGESAPNPTPALVDTPIARNASLRRFLAKRKDRATAPQPVLPFERKDEEPAAKKGRLVEEAASWLALGTGSLWDPCKRAL